MKLTKIKIAGFKSFVDPTTIELPGNLVAVVGPNGCGKSNIIDAVTWVMGESSPKYLRGESSSDVIFNGSSARKPIGQASVELVFDNSDASIGGEYAQYSEISIKRVITRDAESVYYLNGARCRKRDITNIFLGTGLGPRSYSIIGQNMISRIIEAKPDDLRVYLEEAAGISKYKERRHETELRMGHTKENLDRVRDVHAELEKQLANLKHQANVAEKYKSLKQQERILRAELYAIQWRHYDSRLVDYSLQIQREETALEARQSESSGTDREMEMMRHEQRVAQDALQEVQRRYYAVGNEITRIEQDVLHHQERQQQWQTDLSQAESDWQGLKNQISEMEEESRDLEHEIQHVDPQLVAQNKEVTALSQDLSKAEENMQDWQNNWESYNQSIAGFNQVIKVEKTNISHLEQQLEALEKRKTQLSSDQSQLNFTGLHKEVESFSQKSYELADRIEFQGKQLEDARQEIGVLHQTQKDSLSNLDKIRSELQRLSGQQASLEALQQTALGQRDNPATPWITKHQLSAQSRLAQHIEVAAGWEYAVEKALGFALQAICVENKQDVVQKLEDFEVGNLCIFAPDAKAETETSEINAAKLVDQIKSPWVLDSLLAGVYIAESVEEAIELSQSLKPNESVITKDGVWVSRSWLKVLKEKDPAAGVFQREQELRALAERIAQLRKTKEDLEKNIDERREKIEQVEKKRDQMQEVYSQQKAQSAQITVQQKMKQERLSELKLQSERLLMELEECDLQLKKIETNLQKARENYQHAQLELSQKEKGRENFLSDRDSLRQQVQTLREQVNLKNESKHALEIRLETAKSQKSAQQQTVIRLQAQLGSLNERKIALQSELVSMPPLETLKKSLSRALDKHVSVESELNTARVAVESLEQEARSLESKRQIIDREINKIRTTLENLRVETQGWKVKVESIQEQIKETEFKLEDVLKELPQAVTADEWQSKLDQVVQRVNRLGAINLMAIDEYSTCLERKQYLDKQIEDLQSGLNTLEDAINKIDRETRHRFKETFDKVNNRFQELFPTIFGGGRAYLELTEEDLLQAGVTVMATPPGKRNSTIYLLSGGEKSLTAIALVFSIFHLNPAPFCLLDEVDAALDDANVLRFTRLVKTMAEQIQFIFISHNKITIEMAEHLIGVTMNEPGVSRLVSVDIEKAISMTES